MIKGLSLKPRDKTTLLIGGAVLTVMLLVGGVVAASAALRRLDRTIASRSAALRDIARLHDEAQLLQQQIRQAEAKLGRSPGGSLVTVEGLANRVAGQGSLAYLRPLAASTQDGVQVETMELKLERQALEQLLRLLWEVENHPAAPMRIASLRLQRRFENHALLDATMTMNVYRK